MPIYKRPERRGVRILGQGLRAMSFKSVTCAFPSLGSSDPPSWAARSRRRFPVGSSVCEARSSGA